MTIDALGFTFNLILIQIKYKFPSRIMDEITCKSIADRSSGVIYKYGFPVDLLGVPSLTDRIVENGDPTVGLRDEIVPKDVQTHLKTKNEFLF